MPAATQRETPKMSSQHKKAIAVGRGEAQAVRRYLDALDGKRRPGRRRSARSVEQRLADLADALPGASPLRRLELAQQRIDLQAELGSMDAAPASDYLEADFIAVARGYADRKGISYPAWREVGVPAAVLRAARITRA
jgi:hypothetical protein